jgi:branched-subunit amino acid aminotransferase/4-amino-4-deoxychorismate lyase
MASEHVAWLNGEHIPLSRASLSIFDAGVLSGAIVSERLRTFRHETFLLDEHVARLEASAEAAFVPLAVPPGGIAELIREVVRKNARPVPPEDDLAVSVFATPGTNQKGALCVYATAIPARQYAAAYEAGIALATPDARAMPASTLAPQIKTRNRLHWHIADAEASRIDSGSAALLADKDGFVTETATGNLFAVFDGGRRIATPRRTKTLCGISQAFAFGLLPGVEEADLTAEELAAAEEAFVTSSVYCVLPVVRLNRVAIGTGKPGPTYRKLLRDWSERAGVDIAGQMQRMAAGRAGA